MTNRVRVARVAAVALLMVGAGAVGGMLAPRDAYEAMGDSNVVVRCGGRNDDPAIHRAVARGGSVSLRGPNCAMRTPVVIRRPVVLAGQAMGRDARLGTTMTWPAGVAGITLQGKEAAFSRLEDLLIRSSATSAGSADGVRILAHAIQIRNVQVVGFARDGFNIGTTCKENANNTQLLDTRAFMNRRHGYYLLGCNSNAISNINADATGNLQWGFFVGGATNVCVACHADRNVAGAFQDDGSSNHYYSPYIENTPPGNTVLLSERSNNGVWFGNWFGGVPITFLNGEDRKGWLVHNPRGGTTPWR